MAWNFMQLQIVADDMLITPMIGPGGLSRDQAHTEIQHLLDQATTLDPGLEEITATWRRGAADDTVYAGRRRTSAEDISAVLARAADLEPSLFAQQQAAAARPIGPPAHTEYSPAPAAVTAFGQPALTAMIAAWTAMIAAWIHAIRELEERIDAAAGANSDSSRVRIMNELGHAHIVFMVQAGTFSAGVDVDWAGTPQSTKSGDAFATLVDALLLVPSLHNDRGRRLVTNMMGRKIARAVLHRQPARTHVVQLVRACLNHDGLDNLVKVLRKLDGDSVAVRRSAEAVQALRNAKASEHGRKR
jgi:hypothetical protein